ncbi:MAG: hypothetical protein ACLP5V_00505 [Candidatus Bathyarchaeia archaeon]
MNVNKAAGPEAPESCRHREIHQTGYGFDKDGMFSRLVRCKRCGLLMRQYLPMV